MEFYQKDPVSTLLPPLSEISADDSVARARLIPAIEVLMKLQKDLDARPNALESDSVYSKISAIFLYSVMDYAPSREARDKAAQLIMDCIHPLDPLETNRSLVALATHICDAMIRPLRLRQPMAPAPSGLPSRISSSIQSRDDILKYFTPGTRSNVKAKALGRDNYRCLLTDLVDDESFVTGKTSSKPGEISEPTEAAHIIPFHLVNFKPNSPPAPEVDISASDLDQDPKPANAKLERAEAFWKIISWFGNIDRKGLDGQNINRLGNITTLSQMTRSFFDQLKLCFDEIPGFENCFKVQKYGPTLFDPSIKSEVEFTTPNAEIMPLPNPAYLRLHAACTKIAYMSGAGEIIHKLEREIEDMDVLASDGSSVNYLQYRLQGIV
ncbi:hypothetical protein FRC17_002006 [Serendipita sp. 399]|nr:hypothetical protein FRC17_002006 [Serendipita sp. 399]